MKNVFIITICISVALLLALGSIDPVAEQSLQQSSPDAGGTVTAQSTATVQPTEQVQLEGTVDQAPTVSFVATPSMQPITTVPQQPYISSMAFTIAEPPEDTVVPHYYTNVILDGKHIYAFSDPSGNVEYRAYGELSVLWSDGTSAMVWGYFNLDENLAVQSAEPVDTNTEGYGKAVAVRHDPSVEPDGYIKKTNNIYYFQTAGGVVFYRAYASIGSKYGFYPCDMNGKVKDGALPADEAADKLLMQCADKPVSVVNAPHTVLKEVRVNSLINMNNRVPAEYVPTNMVSVKEHTYRAPFTLRDEITYANCEGLEAFLLMVNTAYQEEGIDSFLLCNVYRTYAKQQQNWNSRVDADPAYGTDPRKPIGSAYPGSSEHQTGLAFDITSVNHKTPGPAFASTKEAKWLAQNSWRFGFILRYQKDKEALTGIKFEPYHFRYVGVALAEHLYKNNLCLEEYYDAPVTWYDPNQ